MTKHDGMGLGTVYAMLASLAFVISGYFTNVWLARYLGPEIFGLFGVLMSLYVINRALLNTGIPAATSKFIAGHKGMEAAIIRAGFKLQIFVSILFMVGYIVFSGVLASYLKDGSLRPYIIILGAIIVPLSILYFYFSGYLNGLRRFRQESITKMIFAVSRAVFILFFVFLGWGLLGAVLGFAASTLVTLFVGIWWFKFDIVGMGSGEAKEEPTQRSFPWKRISIFSVPIALCSLGVTFIRNGNTLFLKALLQDNACVGFYAAALTLSDVPYLIFSALTFTITPSISKAVSEQNSSLVRKYITQSFRYLLLGLLPITALIAGTSTSLVSSIYSPMYQPAGAPLPVLVLSSMFLIIFVTMTAIISGSGKPSVSMAITLLGAAGLVVLSYLLIPEYGMMGAALSSALVSLVLVLMGYVYLHRVFEIVHSFASWLRMFLCSLLLWWLSLHLVMENSFQLGAYYLALLALYFLLLFLFGEFTSGDVLFFRGIFRKMVLKNKA